MCWLPADHAVQPGRNTSCIQAAHYAKSPHCVHNTLCPDAGCATVHGQDVFCPQTERTLHIVLSDVRLYIGSKWYLAVLGEVIALAFDNYVWAIVGRHSSLSGENIQLLR